MVLFLVNKEKESALQYRKTPGQIVNYASSLPADAMCSEVLTGWNPTNGICIEHSKPIMKNVLYATYILWL